MTPDHDRGLRDVVQEFDFSNVEHLLEDQKVQDINLQQPQFLLDLC
jgi:SAM-dependent MidA family methyltransferase